MSFIQVTAEELKNRASQLQGLNMKFQAEIENLMNCQNNLSSMWEGEAKDAFYQAFMRDKGSMDNFKDAINGYIQALNTIAARYEEAEKRNLSTASTRTF